MISENISLNGCFTSKIFSFIAISPKSKYSKTKTAQGFFPYAVLVFDVKYLEIFMQHFILLYCNLFCISKIQREISLRKFVFLCQFIAIY